MPSLSSAELSSLLAELYEAPLSTESWQPFFERLCALTESKLGVFLSAKAGEGGRILAGGGVGYQPEPMTLYNAHYGAFDPFATPGIERASQGLISGDELVRREELIKSEFYNDLLLPHDLEHLTVLPCLVHRDRIDVVSLWRGKRQGVADADSLNLMRLIMPHMRSALHLQHTFEALKERSRFLEAMLEHLPAAVFLLNWDGMVVSMNPAAEEFVRRRDCVEVCKGRMQMADSLIQARFESMLAKASGLASNLASGLERESCAPGAMAVPRADAKPPLQLMALPFLREGTLKAGSARVLVFLHDPVTRPRPRGELMKAIYALTPTEGRLADLLVQGNEIREIADAMRISLETARFHLKRVMAKTGTRRQVELMRLMLLLPGC